VKIHKMNARLARTAELLAVVAAQPPAGYVPQAGEALNFRTRGPGRACGRGRGARLKRKTGLPEDRAPFG